PSISAMIVAGHVKDGAILARENGLPRPIAGIIASHHGTSAMEWFRRKASEISGGAAADEWPYRYAGPLPETREETIVSIADGAEAASRSLPSPTQTDLSRLVERIVAARLADGQLGRSALSLAELEDVKRSIVETLVHRLHARAAYPGQR
ncbi:MAG: HD domain-containing protein, partial [Kiritimatiellae bacterium]|nr:HD domain-containing protein [Kiritimatiellia bacterium]